MLWQLSKRVLFITALLEAVTTAMVYYLAFALGWVIEYLNGDTVDFPTAICAVFSLFVSVLWRLNRDLSMLPSGPSS